MTKELSKEDRQSLANAKATVEMEGMILTENETKILEDYLKGILTEEDVLKIIRSNKSIN
ncbi:antitoxin VbhA family protein [Clostridium lacusfryxellense]|uniref:antitoxin VbhA family protein n=1 Tax=Clostridium lacusfryxellense TaxID=205328 RepID=UPI001C0C3207|nr:antitoxin VbhA family protein [Clostridium lacusfryxellense]MBU3114867.1 antitoxin VbhA family protein [Clostridium lacusfryxellense]